jgi:hypothetical protein
MSSDPFAAVDDIELSLALGHEGWGANALAEPPFWTAIAWSAIFRSGAREPRDRPGRVQSPGLEFRASFESKLS